MGRAASGCPDMSTEPSPARLTANGVTLAYDSFGDEAAETILLIAGLGTQMIRWAVPFCRELVTRGYRVVRFDNRDTGRSTHFTEHGAMDFSALAATLAEGRRPELAYTLDDMASDALGLLDVLSIRRAKRRRSLDGRHDRPDHGKRAPVPRSLAYLDDVEHRQPVSATGCARRVGNDDASRSRSRLGRGGLPRSRRHLRTPHCWHCSSVRRRGLPRSPPGGGSERPCAGWVRTTGRGGWGGW